MKLCLYFLLPLLLLSCQSNSPNNKTISTETQTPELPAQWVTYLPETTEKGKHIVLVSGDEEYRSEEGLPQLAKILATHHGFKCTVLFAQKPEKPGLIDPNYSFHIPGLEQLATADLMILFTRFRALPPEQMAHIEHYLLAGKPLIGIRTATHAFRFKDTSHAYRHYDCYYEGGKEAWKMGFGKVVLGETWVAHHGRHKHQSTRGIIAPEAEGHPIVKGIQNGGIWGATDVYRIRMPMGGDAQHVVLGQTIDRAGEFDEKDLFYGMRESDTTASTLIGDEAKNYNPNKPMPPIAWTKSYQLPDGKTGKSFTSTIGSSTDMLNEEVRRLLVNATYHLLELEVPTKASVEFVGEYQPTAFGVHDDAYWANKELKVADFKQ